MFGVMDDIVNWGIWENREIREGWGYFGVIGFWGVYWEIRE